PTCAIGERQARGDAPGILCEHRKLPQYTRRRLRGRTAHPEIDAVGEIGNVVRNHAEHTVGVAAFGPEPKVVESGTNGMRAAVQVGGLRELILRLLPVTLASVDNVF